LLTEIFQVFAGKL